jgi:transglutaminase-like putative cysteine protease
MPVYSITHGSTYRYALSVALSHQALHLEPLATETQECLHFELEVWPRPLEITVRTDYFGNRVHYLTITEPHTEFRLTARSRVTVTPIEPPAPESTPKCGELRDWLESSAEPAAHQARQFLYPSPYTPEWPAAAEFAQRFFANEEPVLEGVLALLETLRKEFSFDRTATTTTTPPGEFFRHKRGVCQDFAHLAVAALRSADLAARYVSGYLLTEPPPGRPRLLGADASHAWAAVCVPDFGWVDFDPTNDCLCAERHITVARGRDYGDVSPVRGTVTGGGAHTLSLGVTVSPAADEET